MACIQDYYEGSLLSRAAYADLISTDIKNNKSVNKNALLKIGFSERQSSSILKKYKISYSYKDEKKGLSFIVFYNKKSDKYIMALRGTESVVDMISNSEIVIGNTLASSAVLRLANQLELLFSPKKSKIKKFKKNKNDIFNKINKLIAKKQPDDIDVKKYKILESGADLGVYYEELVPDDKNQGLLNDKKISIVGHSLGGHLAVAAYQILNRDDIEVYTYNSPGINVQAPLLNALRQGKKIASSDNVTNIHGSGIALIAGFKGWYGKSCEIYTESSSHSIINLQKSLQMFVMFEKKEKGMFAQLELENKITNYNSIIKNIYFKEKSNLKNRSVIDKIFNGKVKQD